MKAITKLLVLEHNPINIILSIIILVEIIYIEMMDTTKREFLNPAKRILLKGIGLTAGLNKKG